LKIRFRPRLRATGMKRLERSRDIKLLHRPRISHRCRDIAVPRWTGSGFGHSVTSRTGSDDAIRQIDPGFLLVFNACRPRIYHRCRDIAVPRWTGSGFGHSVTSRTEVTTPFDRSTPVSYWSSMYADLVSRTVTEIWRFEGVPEAVSGLR
jgi:endogenous inhibitor of DNA gyrase (YacG/DUF329 family)